MSSGNRLRKDLELGMVGKKTVILAMLAIHMMRFTQTRFFNHDRSVYDEPVLAVIRRTMLCMHKLTSTDPDLHARVIGRPCGLYRRAGLLQLQQLLMKQLHSGELEREWLELENVGNDAGRS